MINRVMVVMAAVARQRRLQAVISRKTPPSCLNNPDVKPFMSILFLPVAAVSRGFAAVLRVIPRWRGITGNRFRI